MNHTDQLFIEIEKSEKRNLILAVMIAISIAFSAGVFVLLHWNYPYRVLNTFFNIGLAFSIFWAQVLAASTLILDRKSASYRKDLTAIAHYLIITLIFTAGIYTLLVNLH